MMTHLTSTRAAVELDSHAYGADTEITLLAPLGEAGAHTLTFATSPLKYESAVERALNAGAVILVPLDHAGIEPLSGCIIPVDNPRAAFAMLATNHFTPKVVAGIADTARVHPGATVHETAHIGEFSVVRDGANIGAHSEIRDHVVIGSKVIIGEHALIKSHAVIGEEGFGIEKDADGNNFRIPHLGSVLLGNHVEVGCFTTVCSGTIIPTSIGDYTKIDDHVHIAHNCKIERNVIITACAEISGSVTLEDDVWLGPNSSIIQGVTLGRGSLLGIGAVALRSVPEGRVQVGNPAKSLPQKDPQ